MPEQKYYKFKNVKHSVKMKIIKTSKPTGGIWLENADYPGLLYQVASMDELEEVKQIMNEKQQELYEKLLKKVNEFCLGQAAEDVIAAIDDLVDTYECPEVRKKLKALEIIYTKEVDMNWLALQFEGADIKDLIEYVNNYPNMCSDKPLTDEEITLLKETYDETTK